MSAAALTHVENFNSTLKQLFKTVIGQSKMLQAYALVNRSEKRLNMALNEAPFIGIEIMAPLLMKYANQIRARNDQFFMTAAFDDDVAPEYEQFRNDIAMAIAEMRTLYKTSSAEQKGEFNNAICKLLAEASGYLAETQENE